MSLSIPDRIMKQRTALCIDEPFFGVLLKSRVPFGLSCTAASQIGCKGSKPVRAVPCGSQSGSWLAHSASSSAATAASEGPHCVWSSRMASSTTCPAPVETTS